VDAEAAYYQTIEEFFVSRRGDPLFLSNADWLVIRRWRKAGLPLRVVLRGITDALDAHAHSWSRDRKIGSLAYCAAEVDAAADRWRRSLSGGSEGRGEIALARLGSAIAAGRAPGPATRQLLPILSHEFRSRRDASLAENDAWLLAQEKRLLKALRRDLGEDAVSQLETEVDAGLAPYRARLPAAVLRRVRDESVATRLLDRAGLPRLSLFHAAADAEGP
jgi:hypothetical protein